MQEGGGFPVREGTLKVSSDMSMYYRVYGEGAPHVPVVCLHGYWRTSKDFEELAHHLSPKRKVLTPDLRGRGRSSRSLESGDYDFENLRDDVVKLMDAEGVNQAVFVGLALGAQIIMDLAVQYPERVVAIVFNDSAPETVASSGHRMSAFSGADALTNDEALARVRAQYEETFPRLDEAGFRRLVYRNYKEDGNGKLVRDFDQLTNEALRRTQKAHPTFWPEYEQIGDIPIIVIRGENSDFITKDIVHRMIEGRQAAAVHTIPGTGHPAMMWEPEVFSAVDGLLAEIDKGPAEAA